MHMENKKIQKMPNTVWQTSMNAQIPLATLLLIKMPPDSDKSYHLQTGHHVVEPVSVLNSHEQSLVRQT